MHPAVGPKPVQAEWKRALIDSSGGFFTEVPKAASKYQNEVLKATSGETYGDYIRNGEFRDTPISFRVVSVSHSPLSEEQRSMEALCVRFISAFLGGIPVHRATPKSFSPSALRFCRSRQTSDGPSWLAPELCEMALRARELSSDNRGDLVILLSHDAIHSSSQEPLLHCVTGRILLFNLKCLASLPKIHVLKAIVVLLCSALGMRACSWFACPANLCAPSVDSTSERLYLEALQATPAHLCPVCLRKLSTISGASSAIGTGAPKQAFDVVKRYRQIGAVFGELKAVPQVTWLLERVMSITNDFTKEPLLDLHEALLKEIETNPAATEGKHDVQRHSVTEQPSCGAMDSRVQHNRDISPINHRGESIRSGPRADSCGEERKERERKVKNVLVPQRPEPLAQANPSQLSSFPKDGAHHHAAYAPPLGPAVMGPGPAQSLGAGPSSLHKFPSDHSMPPASQYPSYGYTSYPSGSSLPPPQPLQPSAEYSYPYDAPMGRFTGSYTAAPSAYPLHPSIPGVGPGPPSYPAYYGSTPSTIGVHDKRVASGVYGSGSSTAERISAAPSSTRHYGSVPPYATDFSPSSYVVGASSHSSSYQRPGHSQPRSSYKADTGKDYVVGDAVASGLYRR